MIKHMKICLALVTTCYLLFCASEGMAYPDNTRLGYSSCQTCHVSPTGSGLLTKYGRSLTAEKISTWAAEGSDGLLYGIVEEPEKVLFGGNVRYMVLDVKNDLFEYKRNFLMQAELEAAVPIWESLSAVASLGNYDGHTESQQHYLSYQAGENWVFRAGRFMPAFGIQVAEHNVSTRKGLYLNEGNETYNLEAGYVDEWGEVFVDLLTGGGVGETGEREKGLTAKTSFYLGERSQIGFSIMSASGDGYQRVGVGPQAILGITDHLYLLTDIILQSRKNDGVDGKGGTTEKGYFTFTKAGYEIMRGLQIIASLDQRQSNMDSELSYYQAYGPGMQWFPFPHFELSSNYYKTAQRFFGEKIEGHSYQFLAHYYF